MAGATYPITDKLPEAAARRMDEASPTLTREVELYASTSPILGAAVHTPEGGQHGVRALLESSKGVHDRERVEPRTRRRLGRRAAFLSTSGSFTLSSGTSNQGNDG